MVQLNNFKLIPALLSSPFSYSIWHLGVGRGNTMFSDPSGIDDPPISEAVSFGLVTACLAVFDGWGQQPLRRVTLLLYPQLPCLADSGSAASYVWLWPERSLQWVIIPPAMVIHADTLAPNAVAVQTPLGGPVGMSGSQTRQKETENGSEKVTQAWSSLGSSTLHNLLWCGCCHVGTGIDFEVKLTQSPNWEPGQETLLAFPPIIQHIGASYLTPCLFCLFPLLLLIPQDWEGWTPSFSFLCILSSSWIWQQVSWPVYTVEKNSIVWISSIAMWVTLKFTLIFCLNLYLLIYLSAWIVFSIFTLYT